MNPKVNKDLLKGISIPYSSSLRYTDNLAWNGDVFVSNDDINCPITKCN